jgi:hypothetical protein
MRDAHWNMLDTERKRLHISITNQRARVKVLTEVMLILHARMTDDATDRMYRHILGDQVRVHVIKIADASTKISESVEQLHATQHMIAEHEATLLARIDHALGK